MATAAVSEDALYGAAPNHVRSALADHESPASESIILRWTVPVVLLVCVLVMVFTFIDPIVGRWAVAVCRNEWALEVRNEAKVLGGPLPCVLGAVVLWAAGRGLNARKAQRFAVLMLLALIVGTLSCHFVKMAVGRPRPFMMAQPAPTNQTAWEHRADSRFHSFPSGDVTVAAGFGMVGFLLAGGGSARYLLFLVPVLSMAGRVCGARHYPSDCLAAIVLGVLTVWVLWRLQEARAARRGGDVARAPSVSLSLVEEDAAG